MLASKSLHPLPSPASTATLAAAADYGKPQLGDFIHEAAEVSAVARDSMVIQPALNNTPQPATSFAKRSVHTPLELRLDLCEFGTHSLRNRVTVNRKPTMRLRLGTQVCEPQKIKGLGSAVTVSMASLSRVLSKFNQTSLVLVQLQAKLGKPGMELFQARGCFALVLKANHKSSA